VVRAARRNLISAHLGCAVATFAATKLLLTVVAHLLVILGLAHVAPGSWQARSAAALRTATTTRRALVVAAARCRSLNTQAISQDTASAPRAQTAPTTSPELAWPATQGIMWSRARRLTQTSTLCTFSAYARPTIRAATHRNTTLPNTTPVTPRQTRVVRAARRNLISAHLGCAVATFAATKLLHR
jgi:hypothetical protein